MSNKKKTEFYCQCNLKKLNEEVFTVTWLPSKYAIKDKVISLKDNNIWTDWKVLSASEKVNGELIEARENDYRKHREFSDI